MEPSSATISAPGGIRPCCEVGEQTGGIHGDPDSGRRRPLVAFWDVAVPNTGPSQIRAAVARTRVLPVPAGPVITSTVRGEVRTCQTAAAWSSRSPRGAACSRALCARPRSCASSSAGSAPRRRAAQSPGRRGALWVCACASSLFFQGQLRGSGVSRGPGPGVDAAPVQLAAQRRRERRPLGRLDAHHLTGPPGQGLVGQAEQQFLGFLGAHLPRLRRHHQREMLEQVVPGPGRVPVRHQDQGLGQRPVLCFA